MNYLIIDNDGPARAEIICQIAMILPDVSFHEASNVKEARGILMSNNIHAAFLDLAIPDDNGLDFVPELRSSGTPVVITTDHEYFAVRAFDEDVVDYLLKPFGKHRLIKTLAKLSRSSGSSPERIVLFSDSHRCWPVEIGDILMAEASGSYVTLHLKSQKPITLTRNLKDIESLLGSAHFVRVNRSQIVRLTALKSIRRLAGGLLSSEIEGISTVDFSRRQSRSFRQRYGF